MGEILILYQCKCTLWINHCLASPPCNRDHLCFFLLQTQQKNPVGFTLGAVVGSGSDASQTASMQFDPDSCSDFRLTPDDSHKLHSPAIQGWGWTLVGEERSDHQP
jgi:hypothetical protein